MKKPPSAEAQKAEELPRTCYEVMIDQLTALETKESLEQLLQPTRRNEKVGFVRVADKESCEEIQKIVDGAFRSGRPMRSKYNGAKSAPPARTPTTPAQMQSPHFTFRPALRIQNLPPNVTQAEILSHFDQKGVSNIRIHESAGSVGKYATVWFNTFVAQEQAFSSVRMRIGGLRQTIERPLPTTFKITNCPKGMDQTVLRTHFSPLRIAKIEVEKNRTSALLEVLHITFETAEDMKKGVERVQSLRNSTRGAPKQQPPRPEALTTPLLDAPQLSPPLIHQPPQIDTRPRIVFAPPPPAVPVGGTQ
ncbi:hypothetical protein BLNAU_18826 [Blattamonas nauphoetae]|uniref:RRM domain-containing protein n=1 Tax=Blattamonas nauphoetae TaxID=2049346 RepID=A0ABQ9X4J2_9EUKA|nr:hypothetical protein BLNAU_18826 [Blattamonas nauphoetae]